jgi:hypothetical protein
MKHVLALSRHAHLPTRCARERYLQLSKDRERCDWVLDFEEPCVEAVKNTHQKTTFFEHYKNTSDGSLDVGCERGNANERGDAHKQ